MNCKTTTARLLLVLSLAAPAAPAASIYWDDGDGGSGTIPSAGWNDIQTAIRSAEGGLGTVGTVKLSGDFTRTDTAVGQLKITNGWIQISGGWSSDFTTWTGKSTLNVAGSYGVLSITATNVAVSNVVVTGGYRSDNAGAAGIQVGSYSGAKALTVVLSGLVVSNNTATYDYGANAGGIGVKYADNVRIEQCDIVSNSALAGGGMLVFGHVGDSGKGLIVDSCTIRQNTARDSGGGINCGYTGDGGSPDNVLVVNTRIIGNKAKTAGGGVCLTDHGGGNVVLYNCLIQSNLQSASSGCVGAGVYKKDRGTAYIVNSTIAGNVNTADSSRKGLYVDIGWYGTSRLNILNSIIASNNGVQVVSNTTVSGYLALQRTTINEPVYTQGVFGASSLAGALAFPAPEISSMNDAGGVTQNLEQNLDADPGFLGTGSDPFQLAPPGKAGKGLVRHASGFDYLDVNANGAYNAMVDIVIAGTAPAGNNYVCTTDLLGTPRERCGIDRGAYALGPDITNGSGVTNLLPLSATLTGQLLYTNGAPTDVYVFWGTSDAGATWSGWGHTNYVGTSTQGVVSSDVTLTGETTYYYRFFATNVTGFGWADAAASFTAPVNPPEYGYQMDISLSNYVRSAVLTNFPVLVTFSNNANGLQFSQFASSSGWDLRFSDSGNTRVLNYEIESWNAGNCSYVWVQVPALTSNTTIRAYWRNASSALAPAVYATNGATWANAGYVGVWHLDHLNASSQMPDSTSGGWVGTVTGATNVAGRVANGRGFNGASYISAGNVTGVAGASAFTAECWEKVPSQSSTITMFGKETDFLLRAESAHKCVFYTSNGNWASATGASTIDNNAWHYIAGTYDTVSNRLYVDGALDGAGAQTGALNNNANAVLIGARTTGGERWSGLVDEARLSTVVRSPDWIWASWMCVASNGVFPAYGTAGATVANAPAINDIGATNVTGTSADLVANLTDGAAPVTVTCYWGTNDGGLVTAQWMTNTVPVAAALGYVTNSVSSLQPSTRYWFRYRASNSVNQAWADTSISFSTLGQPVVDNAGGASGVGQTNATLNGALTAGSPTPWVWIYWGTTDGGTDPNAWNQPAVALNQPGFGAFAAVLSGLSANQTVFYRCMASNVYNTVWAPASATFTTQPPVLAIGNASVVEGAQGTTTAAVLAVTLSAASAAPVSVNFATADGPNAVAGTDYTASSGTLIIPAGVVSTQLTVTVIGNDIYEPAKTVNMNLSVPSGVTLANTQGVVTIVNDDWTLFVRGDGLGSDAYTGGTWAKAFATIGHALAVAPTATGTRDQIPQSVPVRIYVAASAPGQSYAVAARASSSPLDLDFEGGWQGVDTAPTQTSVSVVQNVATNAAGISITGAAHYGWRRLVVNHFAFTNVTRGVEIIFGDNTDRADTLLTVSNTTVYAKNDGIYLNYMHIYAASSWGGLARLTAGNVSITAGQGGAGHGVYIRGAWQGSSITASGTDAATQEPWVSSITSANGDGVRFTAYNNEARDASFANTVIYNCATNGINLDAAVQGSIAGSGWSNRVQAAFRNCTIAGNGSDGTHTLSSMPTPSLVALTNSIVANNGGSGINMDGGTGTVQCVENYNVFLNDDIRTNGSVQALAGTSVAADPLFYGQRTKPDPWYKLASSSSPAYHSALGGGNRGAYQSNRIAGGTLVLFR